MKFLLRLLPVILLTPVFASAATTFGSGLNTYITSIMTFINTILVPLVFALAFLAFLWGMFQTFILGGGDEEKQSKGKQLMMYSIAGFVVMISIWGIVNFVAGALGFTGQQNIGTIPNAPSTR